LAKNAGKKRREELEQKENYKVDVDGLETTTSED
jgi:hypothetical protein